MNYLILFRQDLSIRMLFGLSKFFLCVLRVLRGELLLPLTGLFFLCDLCVLRGECFAVYAFCL